ncbi:hypothetical protein AWC38_SpisGene24700 [Stylophora pistillata]|uniref:Uncharacterized protein n=2 Tax=Stylophora pistillata TaxID=50429 RepID=A0A2B4R590_STYPI|nr:hypothetical protein AWC38_SpisGene24700 [Stylophora pistillata]
MARLPLATPGIYRWFLARHSTDQSLCTGSAVSNIAAPGNDPGRRRALLPPSDNITDTRSQTGQVVESRNLVLDGHQCPMHRKVPAEHDDTGTAVCNAATPVNVPGRRHAVLPMNGNTSDTRSQMGQVVDDGQNLVLEGHQFPMHRNVPTEHDDLGDLELVVDEPAC